MVHLSLRRLCLRLIIIPLILFVNIFYDRFASLIYLKIILALVLFVFYIFK